MVLGLFIFTMASASAELVEVGKIPTNIGVTILESDNFHTVVRLDVGRFVKESVEINNQEYFLLSLGQESILLNKAEPALPRICRSIIIPDDAKMVVKILSSEYIDFPLTNIAPSKGNLPRTINPEDVPYTFGPVYKSAEWYPGNTVALREPFILRDYRGTVIDFNAFQYNPGSQTLRVFTSLTIEIVNDGPGEINVLEDSRRAESIIPDFDLIYQRRFINYDFYQVKYSPVVERGDMLIITYDDYRPYIEPFAEWKRQKGIKTWIVNISSIGNDGNNIASWIQDFYNDDSTNLAFTLLVGDHAQVNKPIGTGTSDPVYSKVAGSDDYPDIFIGRFSAQSPIDVQTQVARSITYERNPPTGEWFHKGFGIGSNDPATGQGGEHDWEHEELLRIDLLNYTYTHIDQLYATLGANSSDVSAAINDGRSIGNYTGHGTQTSWSTTGYSNSNINTLVNDNRLPFIVSVACFNGEFDDYTCFGEAWLRATNGTTGEPTGAIGFYGSLISQSWTPPMDAQDEVVDLLCAEAKVTYGGLCFNGSCKMMDLNGSNGVSEFNAWTIFGDPSIMVRTDTPAPMTVYHDSSILVGTTEFAMAVIGIEDALCALYSDNTLYGSAYTDANGIAHIPVEGDLIAGMDMTLTVTAFNHDSYITTIPIEDSGTVPHIVFVLPAQNEQCAPVSFNISVIFNTDMDETTIDSTTFIVNAMSTGFHTGIISYDAPTKTATFNPDDDFAVGEVVTVELITGIESSQGIPLESSFIWNFTVEVDDGPGNFVIDSTYTTGVSARDVAAIDVEGDGDLDLAVVHQGSMDVHILLNNGDGTFTPDSTYSVQRWAKSIIACDFDLDGHTDLAVANYTDSTLSVLMNLGNGDFGPEELYEMGGMTGSVLAADLDGDGDWDLVTPLYDSDSFTILWNNGDGVFETDTTYAAGSGPSDIFAADYDSDGDLDLAITNLWTYKVSVFFNDGFGNFSYDTVYQVNARPLRIYAACLNNDNHIDLAVSHYESSAVSILINNGDGTFGSYITYAASGNDSRSIRAGDLDGDLDLDLYTANMNSDDVSVFWNDGNGEFPERTDFPTGDAPFSALATDLDGDGDLDLTTANLSNSVTVLLNYPKPEVLAVFPMINTLNVTNDADISAIFNIDMDPETINDSTFVASGGITGRHAGIISYDDLSMTATFNPDNDFATGEVVTAVLTTDIESSFSQNLERSIVWSFTIEATSGDTIFGLGSTYLLYGSPIDFSTGDVNGDGFVDLVFSNDIDLAAANKSGSGSGILDNISIYLNDGTGEFNLDSSLSNILLSRIVSVDIDNDLDLDLIGIDDSLKNIRTYKNNGGGRFYPDSVYGVGGEPVYLVSFDADGDGDVDLATAISDSNRVSILSNDGSGVFELTAQCSISVAPQMLYAGDFDNDADYDIAILYAAPNSGFRILTNDGNGSFEIGFGQNFVTMSSIIGAEMTGDSYIDIVVATLGQPDNPAVCIFSNDGDGTFSPYSYDTLNTDPRQIYASDMNADGHLDIIVAYSDYDSISILLNDGSGYFDSCYSYATGDDELSLAIPVDIDNSGSMDIVVASKSPYSFSTLLNTWCDCRPGDANGDGSVNVGDAVYITSYIYKGGPAPTPYPICSGDANCDCTCNVGDVVYIIAYIYKGGPPPCLCGEELLPDWEDQWWTKLCGLLMKTY